MNRTASNPAANLDPGAGLPSAVSPIPQPRGIPGEGGGGLVESRRRSRLNRGATILVLLTMAVLAAGGRPDLGAQDPQAAPPTNSLPASESGRAQDAPDDSGGISLTNELSELEELLGMASEAPDDNSAGDEGSFTNAPSATNNLAEADEQPPRKSSGRESRSRRYSKQRSSQSARAGDSSFSLSRPGTNGSALDYSAFRLVVERNIFDPNRRPPRGDRPYTPSPPRNREPEYFTLVGTMSYEKGTFAFFTGTSSEYQKALTNTDTIAGFKLAAIAPESVRLTRDTNQVELHVGMQMRREDDGSWQPGRAPAVLTASIAGGNPAPGSNTHASSAAESDVLKRLMQKREQE